MRAYVCASRHFVEYRTVKGVAYVEVSFDLLSENSGGESNLLKVSWLDAPSRLRRRARRVPRPRLCTGNRLHLEAAPGGAVRARRAAAA